MNAHSAFLPRLSRRALAASCFAAALTVVLPSTGVAEKPPTKEIGIEKVQVYPDRGKRIVVEPDGPRHRYLDVEIWTSKGAGAQYCVGEEIEIYFRTNADAYVAIYNTDTRGETHRLFPNRWDRDHFVEGGRVYRLPARGYDFRIEGPRGYESIKAVAALDRRDLRAGRYAPTGYYDDDRYEDRYHDDRYDRRSKVSAHPEKIAVTPDRDREIAVDTIGHRVRDGYRCERRHPRTRPWWR